MWGYNNCYDDGHRIYASNTIYKIYNSLQTINCTWSRYKHIQNIIFGRPITVVEYLKLHLNTLFSLASSMRDGGILKDTRRIPIEKMTTNVPLYCGPQAKTKDTKNWLLYVTRNY